MRKRMTILLACFSLFSYAQESPYVKFGKITPQALQTKVYSIDSSANAVVLSDIGEAAIEGNSKGWFSVTSSRHRVIHILNKAGYDYANVEILLYTNGTDEEKLEEVKAVTYNLEGGKMTETKLERSNIFTEKRDKNHIIKKFTMPAVKEGSIIEVQYKVLSDFIHSIDPWSFQGNAPRLWSEFRFSVPQFFSYTFVSHGYVKPFISDKKDRTAQFVVRDAGGTTSTETYRFSAGVTDYRWVVKDVPELKAESFTSTLDNHIAKLEFQLVSQSDPLQPRSFRNSWTSLTKELMDAEYFGADLKGSNGWLGDEMKIILAGAKTDEEKARRIYQFVRDGFSCTSYARYAADQSIKSVFKSRKGTVSEINLLLTAMLRYAGIKADPVLLSQTERGYVYDMYPMMSRFNYVISLAQIENRPVYLDGTHNGLGFGRLLPNSYNGHARVINEEATPLYLMADSLKERKVTALFLAAGTKTLWNGTVNYNPGYYESYRLRNRIKEKGQEEFFKTIQKELGSDFSIVKSRVDSLNNYDEAVGISYELEYDPEKADILYINPMFGEGYKKNPFKSAERLYPVEMPYTIDETFVLTMEVPTGYVVDELPKQMLAKYDEEGHSFFEYRIQQSGNNISMRSRIKLARAYYEPEEYEGLREFFNMVVKKHNEQIVFKKK
ncbi:MAG TPA: transglutaminase domain-containing protein [Flavisolibacter sp.]|nr:transglutaminase domain-containing protein [Flavisolibacter sp.]